MTVERLNRGYVENLFVNVLIDQGHQREAKRLRDFIYCDVASLMTHYGESHIIKCLHDKLNIAL